MITTTPGRKGVRTSKTRIPWREGSPCFGAGRGRPNPHRDHLLHGVLSRTQPSALKNISGGGGNDRANAARPEGEPRRSPRRARALARLADLRRPKQRFERDSRAVQPLQPFVTLGLSALLFGKRWRRHPLHAGGVVARAGALDGTGLATPNRAGV